MIIVGSLVIVCVMLLLGVSVFVAFGAVLMFIAVFGDQSITGYLPTGATGLRSLVLLAIPLFMIAGGVMERGRIAAPLVAIAEMFVGHLKGGLSAAAVLACGVFGSIAGSANSTLTCIGGIMLPHLRKANYPEGKSAALLVAASPLGLLIPPSANHILYGWVAQQHVLKCFLSTVIPAFILITLLIITNHFMLRKHDEIKLSERPSPFFPALKAQGRVAGPALMMPIIILGGIYGGIMTPTEAAGIAVVYAIPVAIYFYRGLTWRGLMETFQKSGITIGVVMIMIFMVLIVSDNLIAQGAPQIAQQMVYSVSDNPIVILLMINVVMILIGMLMDDISGLLLSTPILLPIAQSVGMDPIHFAAVIGVNLGMANITPPHCTSALSWGTSVRDPGGKDALANADFHYLCVASDPHADNLCSVSRLVATGIATRLIASRSDRPALTKSRRSASAFTLLGHQWCNERHMGKILVVALKRIGFWIHNAISL